MILSRRSTDPRGWGAILLGVVVLACAPTLAAEERPAESGLPSPEPGDDARAKALAIEGLAAFDAARYQEAIEKFDAAYQLVPAPGLLYNVAQAYRLNGDCLLALARYRAFLATGAGEKMRRLAEERIAELAPCEVEAQTPPAAPPTLAPTPSTGAVPPLSSPAFLQPAPKALAAPRPFSDASSSRRRPKLVYASVGYGSSLLLLSAGAYFGVRARGASDRISEASERGRTWDAELAATERSGKRDQVVALATLTGGLLSLGVTTCLLAFDW